ncbi:histidine kinase dimerization/phosphoacceptor domain -containing protein [Sphingomonas glaciei]|uniref:GAF domain-containing protein n=1 Tax=Sphingomonas glaciei TaxID=2938948 RepID=A0ABY5MTP4_9SPHN|nr:histidine kinase dimerization/phosphoacceptor domain -containing protein [Sphingomonas glaciei]UUR07873.1 GAF domain-containing protein [Sphingomonas glaciei]
MKAQRHPSEPARLAALRAYDILDTPRESDFDDIVRLAAQICEVPISVVNLIDEHRQWFKAETGLGVRETPLDTSLCAHVILQNDFVEIPDTLADARMSDNPLCLADPGLRFYAGALLKSQGGFPIGTLCVLDNRPRTLNEVQRQALQVLARQVMTQLNLRAVIANEKVLRSEIDHRVKNSLQTVGAFVSLERSATDDNDTRASLGRVEGQIRTVAALHDHLGFSGNEERIKLAPYLDQVVNLLNSTFPSEISVQGRFEDVEVTPREASLVATIVNELAANAAKHSFERSSGTIKLIGQRVADAEYRLTSSDDAAPRAPQGSKVSRREGMGLKILGASVRQLGGGMAVTHNEQGYSTQLDFHLSGA